MESMTLARANEKDFLGEADVHKNPFNNLVTVTYKIEDWDDDGVFFLRPSREYVLKEVA